MYNTRIAPSPTGDMHIGTARTAYFNWLAARASGGKFYLRIDDTDLKRNDPRYNVVILETMDWLGLDFDELFYQSDRFDRYTTVAREFLDKGLAIAKDGAVILMLPDGGFPTQWEDMTKGKINITKDDIEHTDGMVLIKSDGSPSYNWCSVIDDIDKDINLVIRGVDHITNTSKQVILYHCLGKTPPKYAHVGLIGVKGKPLSKRDGASSMLHYRNAGYDSDAMLNFLARLGWGPTVDDKSASITDKPRMLELFLDGGKMRNSPAGFDLSKLESFDRKYKARKGVWRTGEKLLTE
jgi:glutamyl-tRNA synthetase